MIWCHVVIPGNISQTLQVEENQEEEQDSDETSNIGLDPHEKSFTDIERDSSHLEPGLKRSGVTEVYR